MCTCTCLPQEVLAQQLYSLSLNSVLLQLPGYTHTHRTLHWFQEWDGIQEVDNQRYKEIESRLPELLALQEEHREQLMMEGQLLNRSTPESNLRSDSRQILSTEQCAWLSDMIWVLEKVRWLLLETNVSRSIDSSKS